MGVIRHEHALPHPPTVCGVCQLIGSAYTLQIITKDSNQACVVEAIGCVAALAQGLRKEYAHAARNWTDVLFDKLKVSLAGRAAQVYDPLGVLVTTSFAHPCDPVQSECSSSQKQIA